MCDLKDEILGHENVEIEAACQACTIDQYGSGAANFIGNQLHFGEMFYLR